MVRKLIAWILFTLSNLHRRMLVVYFGVLGPRFAYAFTGLLARLLYDAVDPLRRRSEAQARAALANTPYADRIQELARQAFVHRMWNLADLLLADRYLHRGTFARYGGTVPEPYLSRMLAAQRRGQAAILLSAYYSSFDLLPVFLGFNGIHSSAVYLPHANPQFDAHRRRIRGRSGVELIPIGEAARIESVLAAGGTVALIADHHADRKGLPVTFLGLPTRAIRSVGLLAWRYDADVVVAGIRRVGEQFRFDVVVEDIILHDEWKSVDDPVVYITERYLRGLERLILADPAQYLWAYPRWGKEMGERLEREYAERHTGTTGSA
ncbi:MAG TPA: lysophospholipid acyltransferase family protein [Phycisphaerae bacterium]|nr:lysophospholipid acyltransferase family protein [Phycisphaerae bacterium]HOJ73616.1 lysophospholipid acyltransferase family protein [Phycisphaerae bacterium]HOM51575.1 lysophospholipid acyltransferase family protein [Phycisphaerae bacterium]HON68027.1 lysophospholipid acyltransferase family protein [Phycisphaerae bacterium]HOQ88113.1 lysophospholipid acyltransferase family protein [Phycisphaerae bacterium]